MEASALDNTNTVFKKALKDDIAMAMGWDFTLGLDETAVITMLLSDIRPTSGFYLIQKNIVGGSSNYNLFLSSAMDITATPPGGTVPEPSMMLLVGLGMIGMVVSRRKDRV